MITMTGDITMPRLAELPQSAELAGYLRLRPEHGQPVNFVGLLSGLKPVMDDWVPSALFDEYHEMCRDRGLHVTANAQFENLPTDDSNHGVIGRETLTTTRARGHRIDKRVPTGSIHVFVGADRTTVRRVRWAGWYPLVNGDRASSKPWIDHYWFGQGLGYPTCCVDAFARHNNWAVNNMPYQAWRRTGSPSSLCNSIMRFSGLTWTAHLPCRYDCPASVEAGAALRAAMREHCPDLADFVDALAARPYLVLNEWEAFRFSNAVVGPTSIDYGGVTVAPSNRPNMPLFEALRAGSRVEIRDDLVVVFNGADAVWVEECRVDGFAPRIPVVINFSVGMPS